MGLGDLTSAEAVERALDEFDRLGQEAFLAKYGFGPSLSYFVLRDDKRYDSKAVVGAAYAYQYPDREPLAAADFSGGAQTVRRTLERLGFEVEHALTSANVRRRFQRLDVGNLSGGSRAPHKPLLLLQVLRRLLDAEPRLAETSELASDLRELLIDALPNVQDPSPWQPIWRLEEELWEVVSEDGEVLDRSADGEPPSRIRADGVRAGIPEPLFDLLRDDQDLVAEIQRDLVANFLQSVPSQVYEHLIAGTVWWVNQGKTYQDERDGGYIWAPRLQKNGRPASHHTAVSKVRPNDVVIHYSKKNIKALGRAIAPATNSPRPDELPGDLWGADGHRADIEYFELTRPIGLDELTGRPVGQGPFTTAGNVQQGYLYEVPRAWTHDLRQKFSDRWPAESPWGSNPATPTPSATTEDPPVPTSPLASIVSEFGAALKNCGYQAGGTGSPLVRSFVTSLATKPFVILTGLSGSGKTKLAQFFGTWLGEERLAIIAVRPDWSNPDPLLGYENGLSELTESGYAWNVPEALSFMLRAVHDPQHPYILVLDEMNLAHVERYFADVLSGMESGHAVIPNVVLTNGEWRLADGDTPRLPVPRNLFVVGTVNVDETTYMFSPKVLDRANTLEFRVSTSDLRGSVGQLTSPTPGAPEAGQSFLQVATDQPAASVAGEKVGDALVSLHALLAEHGREFGHRTYAEARRFADLYATVGGAKWSEALDLQVLQKALPKLHGSIRELADPLNRLGAWCFVGPGQELPEGFEAADPQAGSAFLPLSFDKVQRMARRLRANHFVSFAE